MDAQFDTIQTETFTAQQGLILVGHENPANEKTANLRQRTQLVRGDSIDDAREIDDVFAAGD